MQISSHSVKITKLMIYMFGGKIKDLEIDHSGVYDG